MTDDEKTTDEKIGHSAKRPAELAEPAKNAVPLPAEPVKKAVPTAGRPAHVAAGGTPVPAAPVDATTGTAWRDYGTETEKKIAEVLERFERHGKRSIVALAGVPGTGKSFIASIAAQRYAGEPLLVREIQFHQSFSYEEFIEGMRIDSSGGVTVEPGLFLEWNEQAFDDPANRYVLLIEELTRANISAVLGELMTYLEYRDRPFTTLYSRRPVYVAKNLLIAATYNPTDRSALEIDSALLRRLRVIKFPPSTAQLEEMLKGRTLADKVIARLSTMFDACAKLPDYENTMPFGHGIFADVEHEQPDLHQLWEERLVHMLRRPLFEPHPYTDTIEDNYPWRKPDYTES